MPKIVDKPLRRSEIARKAMGLFAKNGFESTPIRQITAHAGIGKGTFYDYFVDKEDILYEIVELMFSDWTEFIIAKIGHMDDPLNQLVTLVKEGSSLGDTFEQMMIITWIYGESQWVPKDLISLFKSLKPF